MITAKNYYDKVRNGEITKANLPDTLKSGYDMVDKVTKNGNSWSTYESSSNFKRIINLYFEKLQEYLESLETTKAALEKKTVPEKKAALKPEPKEREQIVTPTKEKTISRHAHVELVELVSLELKFIRRFVNMAGKKKDRNQIRLFINSLQKAIREKRITKTSKFAAEIMDIQDWLIKFHSKFMREGQRREVEISEALETKYRLLLGKQTEYPSVKFIKSYISLQGKVIETKKAKSLHNRIALAIPKKIKEDDKYWSDISKILKRLKEFVKTNPRSGILKIDERELNGLNGILSDCDCGVENNLNIPERVQENTIMNSLDIVNLTFEKLGLTGKWLNLIGNPSKNFTAMIFGKPKMGKSYLAVDFAGYLARNHGRVLYVAKEEGIGDTLREKLDDKNVGHPNLDVSDFLPNDLTGYDFIFFDSVTKLGLSPADLDSLQTQYPEKAFVYIFQTTKLGNFRGTNEFQHHVDVVIEVPEKGRAIQFGRFNQGGSMNIFDESDQAEVIY